MSGPTFFDQIVGSAGIGQALDWSLVALVDYELLFLDVGVQLIFRARHWRDYQLINDIKQRAEWYQSQGCQYFVIFKYLFYRYNMNDTDLRTKKHSVASVKNQHQRSINVSYIKVGVTCQPKQPPNISNHYADNFEMTKKKKAQSRQARHKQYEQPNFYYQNLKPHGKLLIQPKNPRTSYSRNQDQLQLKRTKNNNHVHHIKKCTPKVASKENREPYCTIQYQEIKIIKPSKTQVGQFIDYANQSLSCKQKLLKKISKNLKSGAKTRTNPLQLKTPSEQVPIRKTVAELLAQFESKNAQIQTQAQSEAMAALFLKQKTYFSKQNYSDYLQQRQPVITWLKRAITLDWMSQILSQLKAKRQVFALAANYLDRYLAATENLPLQKLQVVSCAAMSLANKMQGMTFDTNSLSMEGLSRSQILQFQQKLVFALKFKLNPPTANMWANRMCQQWDMYLEHSPEGVPALIKQNQQNLKFRTQSSQGYQNYRMLMQYIDLSILDIHTLRYHNRQLAASFIYLILTVKLNLYTFEHILAVFPTSSPYIMEHNELNLFFCEFLRNSFGFSLKDLLPTVQYCSTFLLLPLNFDLPNGINEDTEIEYSELCSLQTYNSEYLYSIKQRNRGYD